MLKTLFQGKDASVVESETGHVSIEYLQHSGIASLAMELFNEKRKQDFLLRPRRSEDWHEDHGPALWWPDLECCYSEPASYLGTQLDCDAPEWIFESKAMWIPHPRVLKP